LVEHAWGRVIQHFLELLGTDEAVENKQILNRSEGHHVGEKMYPIGQGFVGRLEPNHALGDGEQFRRFR
jgi:hypothetical protein